MALENETSSSDTLERSNITSLQSDVSSTKKAPELSSNNTNLTQLQNCFCQQHTLGNVKFIPCPVLNSNFEPTQYSRQCLCQRFQLRESYPHKQNVDENDRNKQQRSNLKWPRQSYVNKKDKSYEAKSKNRPYFRNDKPFACCEILEENTRKKSSGFRNLNGSSTKYKSYPHDDDSDKPEKIEIYYFDHGNSAYYHTTDLPPILATEKCAEKMSSVATRFWAEIFGYVHIATSFLTAFVLQFLRCILFSLIRPLTVGVIQLVADYFIKPLLSITFNGLIQPFLILFYNVATSLRDCCEPLATALGYYMRELALLFRSCRLIEINHGDRGNVNM